MIELTKFRVAAGVGLLFLAYKSDTPVWTALYFGAFSVFTYWVVNSDTSDDDESQPLKEEEADTHREIATTTKTKEAERENAEDKQISETDTDTEKPASEETSPPSPQVTKRQMVARELLQTERNYVKSLQILMDLKKELEEAGEEGQGPVLGPAEIKLIFGHISPIHEVHVKMLEVFERTVTFWREDCSLGAIILEHTDVLMKVYPTFINYFEQTKESILELEKTQPRFQEILAELPQRPECNKQGAMALLIRPVQRLPSVLLLLQDLLKRTDESSPDFSALTSAIGSLKTTVSNINEAKRKTEGLMAMFDILHLIENCPPSLLSSQRSFYASLDVTEMADIFYEHGGNLTLFLFNDYLEICKRRTTGRTSITQKSSGRDRSERGGSFRASTSKPAYKHIEMIELATIRRIVRFVTPEQSRAVFAITIPDMGRARDSKSVQKDEAEGTEKVAEKLCIFQVISTNNKDLHQQNEFLESLRKNVTSSDDDKMEIEHLRPEEMEVTLKPVSKLRQLTKMKGFHFTKSVES